MVVKNDIERYNTQYYLTMNNKNVSKEVLEKMLRTTKREIRCLSYKLSTVISDGNYHNLIEPDSVTGVEVIENTFIYCKVPCKYRYCPAKFRISYDASKSSDIKVYLSSTHKMPDAMNCEQEYHKPRNFIVWGNGREKKFSKENIYLGIFSLNGASLDILVTFNTEEKALGKIKEIQNDTSPKKSQLTDDQEKALDNLNKTLDHTSFKNNIDDAFKWRHLNQKKREENKYIIEKKIQIAKSKRRKIIIQHQNKNKMFLKRWDIIRVQKEKDRIIFDEIVKK